MKLKSITAVIITLVMLFSVSCKKNNLEIVRSLTETDSLPNVRVWDLHTVYTDSGKIKVVVEAALVEKYSYEDNNDVYFPSGIHVNFYDSLGQPGSNLTSKYAIYHQDDRLWEASDSVVVINSDGKILETELLFWNEKEERIYSPTFVKITTTEDVTHGEGFEADQAFEVMRIKKMTGTFSMDEDL